MKTIGSQLAGVIQHSSILIFFTIALFVSYVTMLAGMPAGMLNYLGGAVIICLLYWPVIIFAFFRNRLNKILPRPAIAGIWIFAFILYPILLIYWQKGIPIPGHPFSNTILEFGLSRFLISMGLTFLLTEIVLQFGLYLMNWPLQQKILSRISLEKAILSVCLLLAFCLGMLGVFEVEVISRTPGASGNTLFFQFCLLIYFTFQFFLILLAYYFFYYCNHYWLIKVILKEKGIVYYSFTIAAMVLICYPVLVKLIRFLPVVEELSIGLFLNENNLFAEDGGGLPFTIMVLSAPIIISNQWFRQHRAIAELEKEKTEGELSLLRQQINPHFFFNTLNNLYALSLTRDKRTPAVILQLSELMRYVIYRCSEKTVSLQEELKYIRDYIELQRIRTYRQLDYRFDISVKEQELRIPPLLFIILVENAFKHGIEPAEEQAFLHLCLESTGQQLIFKCENSIEKKEAGKKGIGLKNLKRRLDLRYPGAHELVIREDEHTFTAIIKLDL